MADRKVIDLALADSSDIQSSNSVLYLVNPDRALDVDKDRKLAARANLVFTSLDQTVGGDKTFTGDLTFSGDPTFSGNATFSNTITGSISGNAGTVTNGVYTSRQVSAGSGLTGGGDLSADRTITHATPSPVATDSNNSNGTVIQDLTFDSFGHTASVGTVNLDSRYYTESEIDSALAAKLSLSGGTMSGDLNLGVNSLDDVDDILMTGSIKRANNAFNYIDIRSDEIYIRGGPNSSQYSVLVVDEDGTHVYNLDVNNTDITAVSRLVAYDNASNNFDMGATLFTFNVNGGVYNFRNNYLYQSVTATSASDDVYRLYTDHSPAGQKAAIEANGDFLSATGSYGTLSDARLKTDVVDANSQWSDIKSLRVVNYRMKNAVEALGDEAPRMLGVVAQEVEAAGMRGLVADNVSDEEGNQQAYKSVKYSILYMKAVKALQEAMERIEVLESKVEALGG